MPTNGRVWGGETPGGAPNGPATTGGGAQRRGARAPRWGKLASHGVQAHTRLALAATRLKAVLLRRYPRGRSAVVGGAGGAFPPPPPPPPSSPFAPPLCPPSRPLPPHLTPLFALPGRTPPRPPRGVDTDHLSARLPPPSPLAACPFTRSERGARPYESRRAVGERGREGGAGGSGGGWWGGGPRPPARWAAAPVKAEGGGAVGGPTTPPPRPSLRYSRRVRTPAAEDPRRGARAPPPPRDASAHLAGLAFAERGQVGGGGQATRDATAKHQPRAGPADAGWCGTAAGGGGGWGRARLFLPQTPSAAGWGGRGGRWEGGTAAEWPGGWAGAGGGGWTSTSRDRLRRAASWLGGFGSWGGGARVGSRGPPSGVRADVLAGGVCDTACPRGRG